MITTTVPYLFHMQKEIQRRKEDIMREVPADDRNRQPLSGQRKKCAKKAFRTDNGLYTASRKRLCFSWCFWVSQILCEISIRFVAQPFHWYPQSIGGTTSQIFITHWLFLKCFCPPVMRPEAFPVIKKTSPVPLDHFMRQSISVVVMWRGVGWEGEVNEFRIEFSKGKCEGSIRELSADSGDLCMLETFSYKNIDQVPAFFFQRDFWHCARELKNGPRYCSILLICWPKICTRTRLFNSRWTRNEIFFFGIVSQRDQKCFQKSVLGPIKHQTWRRQSGILFQIL